MTLRLFSFLIFLAVLFPASPGAKDAVAPGSRNNVVLASKGLPTEWKIGKGGKKNVKWIAEIGNRGYVSPAVADGKVYVATNNGKPRDPAVKGAKGILMCFDQKTGAFLWQIAHEMPPADVVTQAKDDGLLSTPAIEGDRLYYLAPAAELVCASTQGKVLWTLDMMKEYKVHPCYVSFSAPLILGDLIFVVTGNGRKGEDPDDLPEPGAPSFVAVHKKTGKLAWKDSSPGKNIMEGQWASPCAVTVHGKHQVVFPGGDGWLYAFEPESGKMLWKFDANPKDAVWKAAGKGTKSYLTSPVAYEGKVFTGIGQNPDNGADVGHLWCIDPSKSGDISAELEAGKKNPNSGVVWHYGGAAKPGGERDYLFGRSISSSVIRDGLLYIPDLEGFLYCLDAKSGQLIWIEDLKAAIWGSPLWADGKVYLGDDSSSVHIFAHGKDKKRLGKVDMDEPMKGSLVAHEGTLFILGDRHLYAISLE